MRKIITIVAIGLGVAGMTGCVALSNWWDELSTNPAAAIQQFESVEQNVLADVAIAWTFAQAVIPASALPAVTDAYNTALLAINHAVGVLNAAVQAAADAKQPNPNFNALIGDVISAVGSIIAIVDQFGGHVVAPGETALGHQVPGLADAHSGLQAMKHFAH